MFAAITLAMLDDGEGVFSTSLVISCLVKGSSFSEPLLQVSISSVFLESGDRAM